MAFEVIPAIDLRDGKCVRLYQGDFSKETVFSEDPVGMTKRWEEAGAPRLHVVDLDGAATGATVNTETILEIVAAVGLPVQLGGGLRSVETIQRLMDLGVDRVVLGTAAVEEPDLISLAVERFGEAIVCGVDARDGMVATHGWTRQQKVPAIELIQRMERLGVGRFVYTDIARDGALEGPNFESIEEVRAATAAKLIATGGVTSLDQLRRLKALDLEGAILGRAIYSGHIDLKEAVELAASVR